MMVEVSSRDDLERTIVKADFQTFIHELNNAAVNGRAFVIVTEHIPGHDPRSCGLEIKNITRIRDLGEGDELAFIG